ncbi:MULTISPECIES: hypothetical protein [Enterobacteriaceae]|uniref:hypothetical protein n=1 Tax=Enterobacteriaceae TaxID=543 RepID=UPI000CDE1AB6|nr:MULTISPECIES: hypothetical protein [Enterobacteriaceae]POU01816.1 hypothetical protein C3369_10055 [Escherichia sp. ESNIH1]
MAQPYSFRSRKTQIKGNESYKMQMMMVRHVKRRAYTINKIVAGCNFLALIAAFLWDRGDISLI